MIAFISSITNSLSSPDFFIGSGFLGDKFSTLEELRGLIHKYADNKDGVMRDFTITFAEDSTIDSIRETGDRQCKENGQVNLFTLAAQLRKDRFHGIKLHHTQYGWSDNKGIFYWVEERNGNLTPLYGMKFLGVIKHYSIL